MAKKKPTLEEWLRGLIKTHKRAAVANRGSVNALLHQERVFAYKNVLVQLGYEEVKTYSECLKDSPGYDNKEDE